MADWLTGKIIEKIQWNERLFSLRIQCDFKNFESGQFVRVALDIEISEGLTARIKQINIIGIHIMERGNVIAVNLVPDVIYTPVLPV